MDNLVEEAEIKIEYNETFELDPLCEKHINTSEYNINIEELYNLDEHNIVQRNNINMILEKKNRYFNDNNTLYSVNNNSEKLARKEVAWYDSIDISGRFLCKFCELKYSTLQTLRYHVKSKHPEQANNIKENVIKNKRNSQLKCHICKQRFKEILALKSHVVDTHPFEDIKTSCLYCDAVFSTQNEMSQHLYVQHKKVISKATYMCNICGYRTSTKSHYNQHLNIHVDDRTKKCHYCDYATNYLPNLKIHERIHTKDKVYVCDFTDCNYRCTARSALRSHQLKHNPEGNVLYCDKCNYKTIYRQSLRRHDDCHKRNSIKLKLH